MGVPSDIYMVAPDNREEYFTSAPTGTAINVNLKCEARHRLIAKPSGSTYFASDMQACREKMTFNLIQKTEIIQALEKWALQLKASSNNKDAALVQNELAARLRSLGRVAEAEDARVGVYVSLGEVFKVESPVVVDPVQNETVMTKELMDKIKDFQKTNALEPDGIIGSQTLRALAGKPISTFLPK